MTINSAVEKCQVAEQMHPYLIVKASEFDELRNRSLHEPWARFKSTAISVAVSLTFNTESNYMARCVNIRELVDTCSLAYIVDPDNKTTYINKIVDVLNYWNSGTEGNIFDELNNTDWTYSVPPSSAFFSCVLALDTIYPELSFEQLDAAESLLQNVADWFWSHNMSWQTANWGSRGIWALYKNDTTRIVQAKEGYFNALMSYISDDGVGIIGTGYSNMRFSCDRHSKQYFMDVLTYTGQYDYYNDSKVKGFYEWLYGYASTAFKRIWIYGDTSFNNAIYRGSSIYKAGNLSPDIAKYAAWLLEGYNITYGRLLIYILLRSNLPEPKRARSKIYPDGGAYFFENSSDPGALAAVMWNTLREDGHGHKEVNAINVAAYGEFLLVNSGYNGWGNGAAGFPWSYIHDRAVSCNTALIDYNFNDDYNPPTENDHQSKHGNGISEGFTSELLCYASGDSGSALPNGKHIRNFISILPDDSANGYWVLFDEIDAVTAEKTVHIALHPPTVDYFIITPYEEYEWKVNKISGEDVFFSVYLGTEPIDVKIREGAIGSWTNSFISKYIYSTYITNKEDIKKNIITILFPHNIEHAKAIMKRISGVSYKGIEIQQDGGSTIDYVIESSGKDEVIFGGTTFCGLCVIYRKVNRVNTFYFVKKGLSFDDGNFEKQGFSAEADVSVYINDNSGSIVSPGTNVTFYYPGIKGVKLDKKTAVIKNYGEGWMTLYVPFGTYTLRLIKGILDK